jgi:seryl-tRNA synthetase
LTSDLEQRALRLLEEEENRNRNIAARRREQEREGRLKSAIEKVKKQDREQRVAQDRKEAEARVAELGHERYELEERIEAEARALNRSLNELQNLHDKQLSAMRRAGLSTEGRNLSEVVTQWWKDRFGSPNSITGTPTGHMDSAGRYQERIRKSLAERDTLASPEWE